MSTLEQVYHVSVGRNGFLMMDFGPDKDGLIAPDQVAAYKRFGDWIRRCYGFAVASARGTVATNQTLLIRIPNGTRVDRVMIRAERPLLNATSCGATTATRSAPAHREEG